MKSGASTSFQSEEECVHICSTWDGDLPERQLSLGESISDGKMTSWHLCFSRLSDPVVKKAGWLLKNLQSYWRILSKCMSTANIRYQHRKHVPFMNAYHVCIFPYVAGILAHDSSILFPQWEDNVFWPLQSAYVFLCSWVRDRACALKVHRGIKTSVYWLAWSCWSKVSQGHLHSWTFLGFLMSRVIIFECLVQSSKFPSIHNKLKILSVSLCEQHVRAWTKIWVVDGWAVYPTFTQETLSVTFMHKSTPFLYFLCITGPVQQAARQVEGVTFTKSTKNTLLLLMCPV